MIELVETNKQSEKTEGYEAFVDSWGIRIFPQGPGDPGVLIQGNGAPVCLADMERKYYREATGLKPVRITKIEYEVL